jgi:molecular chaperone DnaJ
MVLGVTPDAELEVMAAVYRSLSRKYHPDTHPGDKKAEERMLELNAAWEILKDPKKKEEYDRALRKAGL